MKLSTEQIQEAQGNTAFKMALGFALANALREIHLAVPGIKPSTDATDQDKEVWNKTVRLYNSRTGVASKLEQNLDANGTLKIYPATMFIAALASHEWPVGISEKTFLEDQEELITIIQTATVTNGELEVSILEKEAMNLVLGYSYRPQEITVTVPA